VICSLQNWREFDRQLIQDTVSVTDNLKATDTIGENVRVHCPQRRLDYSRLSRTEYTIG